MERIKYFLQRNKKQSIAGIGILILMLVIVLISIYIKNQLPEQTYYYENKLEAMLAQRTIDYLDQNVVMKRENLEEMGDKAVETYNTILSSGISELTDEHSAAIEASIREALYSYLHDESLSAADYEMLSAGIGKIILDILLTELINSELAINVNYKKEFDELTSSLNTQIRDIEERMEKLKVNASIRFNTDKLQADINQAISSSLDKSKDEIYESLGREINSAVEKQLVDTEKEIISGINQDIDGIKDGMTREIINEVKSQIGTGKAGSTGAAGKDGANGKDGATGPAGKDGIDGKDGAAGKDGMDGANGKSTYIAYADDNQGNGFSLTPTETSKYIGTCITEAATQPQTVDQYSNWQEYRAYIMTVTTDEHGEATLHIR